MELLETEASYLSGLDTLKRYYEDAILDQSILNPDAVKLIFSNLHDIISINQTFYDDLHERTIIESFDHITPFFRAYAIYAENFDKALTTIHYFTNKLPQFAALKERQQKLPISKSLSIEAYLMLPIQRLPRYRLLLESLAKASPDEDSIRPQLLRILTGICEVCDHMNAFIENGDRCVQMISLQSHVRGISFIAPGRRLLLQGSLNKMSYNCASTVRNCMLFNDLFVFARAVPKSNDLYSRGSLNLAQTKIRLAIPPMEYMVIPRMIMLTEGSVTVLFFGDTFDETMIWLREIERCIWNIKESKLESMIPKIPDLTEEYHFKVKQMSPYSCTVDHSLHIVFPAQIQEGRKLITSQTCSLQ